MQMDEDQAELRLFQEKFLKDGDLHTDYKRTKQFRCAEPPIPMPGSVVPGCLEERDKMLKQPEDQEAVRGPKIWSKNQLQLKNAKKAVKRRKKLIQGKNNNWRTKVLCTMCKKVYSNKHSLKAHMKSKHNISQEPAIGGLWNQEPGSPGGGSSVPGIRSLASAPAAASASPVLATTRWDLDHSEKSDDEFGPREERTPGMKARMVVSPRPLLDHDYCYHAYLLSQQPPAPPSVSEPPELSEMDKILSNVAFGGSPHKSLPSPGAPRDSSQEPVIGRLWNQDLMFIGGKESPGGPAPPKGPRIRAPHPSGDGLKTLGPTDTQEPGSPGGGSSSVPGIALAPAAASAAPVLATIRWDLDLSEKLDDEFGPRERRSPGMKARTVLALRPLLDHDYCYHAYLLSQQPPAPPPVSCSGSGASGSRPKKVTGAVNLVYCKVCGKVVRGVYCGSCCSAVAWHKYCFKQVSRGVDVLCGDCGVVVQAPLKLPGRRGSEKTRAVVADLLTFQEPLQLSTSHLPTHKDVIRAVNFRREISPSYSNLKVSQDVAR